MHAAVCLLRAGQPKSAGNGTKSGQFVGQFSWVTGVPIGIINLNGLSIGKVSEKTDLIGKLRLENYLDVHFYKLSFSRLI